MADDDLEKAFWTACAYLIEHWDDFPQAMSDTYAGDVAVQLRLATTANLQFFSRKGIFEMPALGMGMIDYDEVNDWTRMWTLSWRARMPHRPAFIRPGEFQGKYFISIVDRPGRAFLDKVEDAGVTVTSLQGNVTGRADKKIIWKVSLSNAVLLGHQKMGQSGPSGEYTVFAWDFDSAATLAGEYKPDEDDD